MKDNKPDPITAAIFYGASMIILVFAAAAWYRALS